MGSYSIEQNSISWKYGFFKKTQGSVSTEKIIAVIPYKKNFLSRHKVKILSGENQISTVDIKMSKSLVTQLIESLKTNGIATLYSDRLKGVLSVKNGLSNDIKAGKYHKVKKDKFLYCYDNFTLFVNNEDNDNHIIKHENVVFFKNYKNGFKQEVYFGSNSSSQATVKLASKEDVEFLKGLILTQNDIINFSEGGDIKERKHKFSLADIIHPSRWRTKERVILRESGILFEQKKGKKIDTIYLPYEEINSHSMKNNILTGKLVIYGSQNIVAKRRFSKATISELRKIFKDLNKKTIKGSKSMCYYCFLGIIPVLRRPSKGKIVYNDEGISIKPSKDFKKRHQGQKVKLDFLYDEVSISFEKYKFLSPRRNVRISPRRSSNIRSGIDQIDKSHEFTFKGFNKTKGLKRAYDNY